MIDYETTLVDELADTLADLERATAGFSASYPGDGLIRQPVHVVYGGAHLFAHDSAAKLGAIARRTLDAYAPTPFVFARALGLPGSEALARNEAGAMARYITEPEQLRRDDPPTWLAITVYERVRTKLEREPVEDFRIDFEDGYGYRPDDEEDATAINAARELVRGMAAGTLPPFIGLRIKPLSGEHTRRALRTLELFVTTLAREGTGLPPNFVVTLPKISVPEQVSTLVRAFELLESRLELPANSLRLELMIELTHGLFDSQGQLLLPHLHAAAAGRCVAAHFGTYDFCSSYGVTANHQRMDHPACDFALDLIKASFAETGLHVANGATNILPIPRHRGTELTAGQLSDNRDAVHSAWRLSHRHIHRSLMRGYYQGWDLHPAQLPVRYATCYAFFLSGFDEAAARLRNFIDQAAKATLVGEVFDDAATGQGLLNYFLRALACGALAPEELAQTGLSEAELRMRSFSKILAGRRTPPG